MRRPILAEFLVYLIVAVLISGLPGMAVAATAADTIKQIEGVYKRRFVNGMVVPGKADTFYKSEDIVEIVRYDDTHIYVRAVLQFYNGHSCSFAAIAGHENGRFVFRDPEPALGEWPACTLTLTQSKDALSITDRLSPDGPATCKHYCGVRGSLSQVSMPMSARRPITYMPRIINSRHYQKAVGDLEQVKASRPAHQ